MKVKLPTYGIHGIDDRRGLLFSVAHVPLGVRDAFSPMAIADDKSRRDFLYMTTGSMAALGSALSAWPFIDSMNPARNVVEEAELDVDVSDIPRGQTLIIRWRGKPVFIRHRTADEIASARKVKAASLPRPEDDKNRAQRPEWLVVVGICTHLGCIPLGSRPGEPRGEWGGWFCACHGSQYDTSGRIRKGPAPLNLAVPPYRFLNNHTLRLGASPDDGESKA